MKHVSLSVRFAHHKDWTEFNSFAQLFVSFIELLAVESPMPEVVLGFRISSRWCDFHPWSLLQVPGLSFFSQRREEKEFTSFLFFFLLLLLHSIHGSYEGTGPTLHYGTGATVVHAGRPLQRERALSGPRGGPRGRAAGLEAGDGDREARGGKSGSQKRENGSPVDSEGAELLCGTDGFTQLENRQRGSGCRWVAVWSALNPYWEDDAYWNIFRIYVAVSFLDPYTGCD